MARNESAFALSVPLGHEAKTTEELTNYLLTLWPNQADLDLIIDAQVSISILLHGVVCHPYEDYFAKHIAPPRKVLQKPVANSHPVIVARNMLLLVTLLHSLPPSSVDAIPGLSINHRDMIDRIFNAATKLVTSNDELMCSIEGIESFLLESMYLTNMGNLRRAWLVNRRAMVISQMMGIQTGKMTSALVVLDRSTLERVYPDFMWFRLVTCDRHLSLLLGLPQATPENVFSAPGMLESYAPLERFERIMTVACSLILQRNTSDQNDLETTYEIDKTLQKAATLMPPEWWLASPPDVKAIAARNDIAFKETLRLMNQLIYHHLLVQLHLPYMLLPSLEDPRYDCSKITVANASRAILTRFIAFHSSAAITSYCRGIDFIAFIVSTTLCLVHIEARRQQYYGNIDSSGFSLLQPLLHQRLGDRGLLDKLLAIVQNMAKSGVDPVAKRIASILEPLLEIEENSYRGGCYSVSASDGRRAGESKSETSTYFGDSSNAPHTLRIKIPYFGTIRIEHHPTAGKSSGSSPTDAESQTCANGSSFVSLRARETSFVTGGGQVSSCSSDSGMSTPSVRCKLGSERPVDPGWEAVPSLGYSHALSHPKSSAWDNEHTMLDNKTAQEQYLLVPGLPSAVDDWALQGVDIALFSSLTSGSMPNA